MFENINMKESLRANGAYTCPVFQWNEKTYEISNFESMYIDIANAISDFQNEVNKFVKIIKLEYDNFDSFIISRSNISDEKLLKMIANISKGDISAAYKMAHAEVELGNRGGYRNKGRDIYEYIIEYCNKHIINKTSILKDL